MHTLLTLLGKDFANLRRNRGALILSFIVPMIIIYIVGMVFGLGRSDDGPSGIPLAVVNASDSPAAQKLLGALRTEKSFRLITEYINPDKTTRPLTETDLRTMIHDRQFSYALVIPADMLSDDRIGLHLKVLSDPRSDIESQMVNGLLQKTIFSNVPELLGQSLQARAKKFLGPANAATFNRNIASNVASTFGGDPNQILANINSGNFGVDQLTKQLGGSDSSQGNRTSGTNNSDVFSRIVQLDQEQVVGKDVKSPQATRIVGGYAVMFLLFALANSSAAFFDEKNSGIFQRVLSAPVSRAQLLWSRFLYGVLFGLGQLMALFLAGHVLYGVDVFGHLGNLLVVCASVAAACTGFGMLLSAIVRSADAARSLATLLVITMSACGGAWFPISFMPAFMQHIAHFTLVYWAIEGFNSVLWAGDSFLQMLPTLSVLIGITIVVMSIAVWKLNRSALFE